MRSLIKLQHALINWHYRTDKDLIEYLYSSNPFSRVTKDSQVLRERKVGAVPELPDKEHLLSRLIQRLYPELPKNTLSMVYSVVCEEQMARDSIKFHQRLGDALALRELVIKLLTDTTLSNLLDQQVAAGRFRIMDVV